MYIIDGNIPYSAAMFYFNFKDKECSLKIKLIQDLFVILYLFSFSFLLFCTFYSQPFT